MDQIVPLIFFTGIGAFIFWLVWRKEEKTDRQPYDACLQCGYDLRYSTGRCPECGAAIHIRPNDHFPLRDDWPATPILPRMPNPDETPVLARVAKNASEARLMREQLIARGIAAWVEQHEGARVVGHQNRVPIFLNLMVWSADEALAKDLLDHLTKPQTPVEARD